MNKKLIKNPNVLKIKIDKELDAVSILFEDKREVVYLKENGITYIVEFFPVKESKLIIEDFITSYVLTKVRKNYASIITNGRDIVLSPTVLTLLNKGIRRVIVESDNNSQRFKTEKGEIIIQMNMKKHTTVTIERARNVFDIVKLEADYNNDTLKEQIIRIKTIKGG